MARQNVTVALEARFLTPGTTGEKVYESLARHYASATRIHVTPSEESDAVSRLDSQAMNATDSMQISVFGNREHGQILLSAVLDNLGKGAAGAAVENLNLMLAQY